MTSLAKRLLTAIVLIPAVVWVVMYSSEPFFIGVLSLIVLIAGYEWAALSAVKSKLYKSIFAITGLLFSFGLTLLNEPFLSGFFYASLIFWLLAIVLLITKAQDLLANKVARPVMLLIGYLLLGLIFISLYQLRLNFEQGPELLMYLLLLMWIADSGAYFAGRSFGYHKLSPLISPGKSIEGVIGGALACLLLAFFADQYFEINNSAMFISVSVFVAFVSVFGDLFESLMKRRVNVKDSGAILPGHGGVLDRIDSLIAAAPVYVACLLMTKLFT